MCTCAIRDGSTELPDFEWSSAFCLPIQEGTARIGVS